MTAGYDHIVGLKSDGTVVGVGDNSFGQISLYDWDLIPQYPPELTVQAEDYDKGGQNIGYFDKTPGNKGERYRSDDVDIWWYGPNTYYIGANATGEWLNYTIDVPYSGNYRLDIRVATPKSNRRVHVEFDGMDGTGPLKVPNTGWWTTWQTLSASVTLNAGRQVMRLVIDHGGLNIDQISLVVDLIEDDENGLTVQTENYDQGGQDIAYFDKTPGNKGGRYRSDDVDIWWYGPNTYYIGANATGEWLNYTIDVPYSGDDRLDIRVATPKSNRRVHVEFDGMDGTGPLKVPNTGWWTTWQTLSASVTLNAGRQVMGLVIDHGGLNIDQISLVYVGN